MTYADKLKDPRWQKKRLEVLNRDNWTCLLCKETTITLHVHHKTYKGDPWEIDDKHLETLCATCHSIVEQMKKLNKVEVKFIHYGIDRLKCFCGDGEEVFFLDTETGFGVRMRPDVLRAVLEKSDALCQTEF